MERQGGVDTSVDGGGRSSPLASSDNDAVNTSSARVYFGPIQSAEKQRAERVKFGQPTPVRRSARLSSGLLPQSRDVGATGAGQEFAGNDSDQSSGSNTPALAEDLLEEPSSVLAKRILRAWDNPSPPPSPPPQPSSTPTPELDQDDVYAMVADDVERDQNNAKENSEAPREDVYEEDLITFESFSSSSSAPQMKVMPATPPNPTRSTVDDLLSLSPFQSLPDSQTLHAISIGEEVARESTPSVADEAEVAFTLSNPSDPATSSPIIPAAEATYLCEPEAHIPLVVLTPTPQPEPHTPLRRSTRPRRSVSPFITPLTGLPSKLDLTPSNIVSSTPNTSATRVRKAKAKDADIVKPDNRQEPLNQANAAAATTSLRPPASIIDELLEELNNDIIAQVEVEDNSMVANPKSFSSGAGKPSTPNVKRATHRLGSLSPTSNNMLMQLLPSPGKSPAPVVDDMIGPSPGLETSPSMPASSGVGTHISPQPDVPLTPAVPATPQKSSAPFRAVDIARTPARRVLISDAVAQGSLSPEKARTILVSGRPGSALGTALFATRTPYDPPRSPAKRVPIEEALHTLQTPQKGKTPVRPSSLVNNRSSSVDTIPAPSFVPKVSRSASVEPPKPRIPTFRKPASTNNMSQLSQGPNALPFPVVSRLPSTIVEVDEGMTARTVQPPLPTTPSSLRQPSARAESRIPRPGSKPYARPVPLTANGNGSRLPAPTAVKKAEIAAPTAAAVPRPMRMVRKVSARPVVVESSSDTDSVQPIAGPGPRTLAHRTSAVPATAQNPSVATLKRKREITESRASPPGVRPVVLLRKVVTGPSAIKAPTIKPRVSPSPSKKASPAKATTALNGTTQGRIKMRKVVDTRKPKEVPTLASGSHVSEQNTNGDNVAKPSVFPSVETPEKRQTIIEVMSSPIAGEGDESVAAALETPATDIVEKDIAPGAAGAESSEVPQESAPEQESRETVDPASTGLRRTTRSRKSATDVFGPVAAASSRPTQQRRKSMLPPDNSAFSGMSALALKSLTATNTHRNQKQFSELQTEVILKEGKRPDSPTTKVRTTLDQQRDERNQQRQERAARRAKKTAEAEAAGVEPDLSIMTMDEDLGDLSVHARGPGDEEDYETPEKPERPLKRGRFDEVGSGGGSGSSSGTEDRLEKRVKWDRGLSKTVYFTGTPPNPRRPPKEEFTKKGCLATRAKILRLDTMGNVLNAEAPVPDIIPESIVVQKFMYEDDPEAQPEPSSPAKATRSKSKKAKS